MPIDAVRSVHSMVEEDELMNRSTLTTGCCMTIFLLHAAHPAAADGIPAFPGAEGFGAMTPGGRGGQVFYVTNLEDHGPGSLRSALEATGPRFVLFKVSGTIELTRNIQIAEANSFVTLAGQTAPGDGVQLKNWTIDVRSGAHDVVIRHVRFRPGTGGVRIDPAREVLNGNQIDGLLVYGNTTQTVQNVVLDHCSIQWAVDENGEVWGRATDVTFQWCIMAEGALWGHEKGRHSMGMIMGAWGGEHQMRVSVHHSLFAHNLGRSPLMNRVAPIKPDTARLDFRNNVIYNWGGAQGATELGAVQPGGAPVDMSFGVVLKANLINNVYLPGPDTGGWFTLNGGIGHVKGPLQVFLEGNYGPKCEEGCSATHWDVALVDVNNASKIDFASRASYGSDTPFKVAPVTTTPTEHVVKMVLADVGATKPRRDAVDTRIVEETMNRTGQLGPFDGVEKIPASRYPVLHTSPPPVDSDNDGMPDVWERAHGLDADDPADGRYQAKNGYTHIENYLNELAGYTHLTESVQ